MLGRILAALSLFVLVAGVAALLFGGRTKAPDPEDFAASEAEDAAEVVPPPPVASAPAHSESLLYRRTPPEVEARLRGMEEVDARLAEVEHQAEATRRFRAAADEGRYEASDMNRSVVDFFRTMELEPLLDDDAMMVGLEIRTLFETNPLRAAGIREGDVITSLNDEPLYDPADLPARLVRLERDLTLCVDREGTEICRRVTLE